MVGASEGEGSLRFVRAGPRTVVHTARARSPMKLLLPRNHGEASWAYVASLGGGLVDGDALALAVEVDRGASALVGTQASTKVYRSPRGTTQSLSARVARDAMLALVPDPVSCFAGARYAQSIDVELEDDRATLVLVDAFTCGRAARGERWAFDRYGSRTRVTRAGRLLVLEAVLLDPAHGDLTTRMGSFEAFATVLAVGPRAEEVRARLLSAAAGPPLRDGSRLHAANAIAHDVTIGRVAAGSAGELSATLRALASPLARELGDDPFARRW
jgi:urease accessory protein